MAHFRATVQGNRGEASRTGTATSGIVTETASWQGKVYVSLRHDPETKQDIAYVALAPHFGEGVSQVIYEGPVSGARITESV